MSEFDDWLENRSHAAQEKAANWCIENLREDFGECAAQGIRSLIPAIDAAKEPTK